jgi:small-conductance mechanosensitive channel
MDLAQEHINLLRMISSAVSASGASEGSLQQKIDELANTVPELTAGPPQKAVVDAIPAAASSSDGGGIIGLAAGIWHFMSERGAVRKLHADTGKVLDENRTRSQSIRAAVQALMAQSAQPVTPGAAAPVYGRLIADMKTLGKAAVPMSRLNMALTATQKDLGQWSDLDSERMRGLAARLFWRLTFLIAAVLGLLVATDLADKAMRRYIIEERRQNQIRIARKIFLAVSIGIVVFFGVFTDLGSIATYAGLLTAGLAVALQNVIMSVIAYFQFFGVYGIKPGDRITLQNATGKVVQVGLLSFYMMEMEKSDLGYLPTGRVVGFPNSILFQPLPFFRQTPGANFVWSEINLALDAAIDYEAASKKIHEVVQRVYARQREAIQKQERTIQNITRVKVDLSEPQIYSKITGRSVEFVIRYAVPRDEQGEMHTEMTEALLTAIRKDPELKSTSLG